METVFIFAFIFVAVITIAFVRLVQNLVPMDLYDTKACRGHRDILYGKNSLGKFSKVFISYSS